MKTKVERWLFGIIGAALIVIFFSWGNALAQTGPAAEWERIVAAAKKEGKLVAGIPASAELRKQIEATFKSKYPGIEVELSPSRGPQNIRKIADEYQAGVRNFDLSIGGTQRQIADALAKGKLSLTIGISYYTLEPFIKAGLPVKALPLPKEGTHTSNGSGTITILKNPPHPNTTKVFVNWLLSREGQEIFGKAMGQATRRLDVDTKWLKEFGIHAAKDVMNLETYHKTQNHLEDAINQYRRPAMEISRKLIP